MFKNIGVIFFVLKSCGNSLIIRSESSFPSMQHGDDSPFEIEFEEVFVYAKIYDC
jgi:hypothetical protein